jgi:DNA polymerase V
MKQKVYVAIDLKSFYASVECTERGLDPLTTNLVVADTGRTEKTICLAVSPSLKAYGIPGRARLFEVVQRVREINEERRLKAPGRRLSGESSDDKKIAASPQLAVSYIAATPRMAYYMEYSTRIYHIYLKYIAPEDIHVYSIDEVFMDVTDYLNTYRMTAGELAMKMILEVLHTTGITATAGIGTNLYLCKVAMDIQAKHIPADENGVRIAQLDEMTYREKLWEHRPLRDFWRVGHGYAAKLEANGLYTMGDIARCSLGKASDYYNEDLLYKLFGINAELLIDHAWGWEPCTIADIRSYQPENNSLGSGQVLQQPYEFDRARLIVKEMTDLLVLDLVDKGLVTDQMVLNICYDVQNLADPKRRKNYKGPVTTDHYGRPVPKDAHGSVNLGHMTSSSDQIIKAVTQLYEQITDPDLLVRKIYVTAARVMEEKKAREKEDEPQQMDLFTDYSALEAQKKKEQAAADREKRRQKALLEIRKKYGKNAVIRGMDLEEGAMTIQRNGQIGGHKA